MFRLIATDLDGTLLDADSRVSARTVEAVRRVQQAGAMVVPVTARPTQMTIPLARQVGIVGVAICGNGAILLDLETGGIVAQRSVDPATASAVITALRVAAPGVLFGCEDGLVYRCEPGYPTLLPESMCTLCDALEFVNWPISKLVARHPGLEPVALLAAARAAVGDRASVENSGPEWVEIHAVGVTKGAMVAQLASARGIAAEEVVAFGDYATDVPMLRWAGLGVAPANAFPEALAVADEVCPANDEDGVAQVLERLLDAGAIGAA